MRINHFADGAAQTAAAYGNAARVIASVLEHQRECSFFIYMDMQVGYLNAAARRDVESQGADPAAYPGHVLWELLGYSPDTPARRAVEWVARHHQPAFFCTRLSVHDQHWVETDVVPAESGILITYRDAPVLVRSEPVPVVQALDEKPTVSGRSHVGSGSALIAPQPATSTAAVQTVKPTLTSFTGEFRVLADDLPMALVAVDAGGTVRQWSAAAEQMFQWRASEVMGRQLPIVPMDVWPHVAALFGRVRAGTPVTEDIRLTRRDGEEVQARVGASQLRSGGDATILLAIADESRRQRTEALRRAVERMEAVRLLAGGVAHEFNNLLTAIKGFTVLLRGAVSNDPTALQHATEIDNAAERAAVLTAELLAFGRGQLLRPEPLDLNARLRQLERMLRLMLRDDGELLMNLAGDLGDALVDAAQLEEVVLNLVVNARDAIRGHDGGRVTITTSNADLEGEFSRWGVQSEAGPYIRIDVAHNGHGMDATTQAHIFEPFYSTREGGLHGLGLATVYGIVKQSSGYIWVESNGREGAVFSVYLPRAMAAAAHAAPVVHAADVVAGENSETAPPMERILLVEDEDAVRRISRRSLEMCGYEVLEASDGASALRVAEENDIAMLVTDVMMPVMLGTTLVERLRGRLPDLPVLFMSGHCDALVRDGVIHPSTPFLQKPFTPAQLTAKVREILARARPEEVA